MGGRTLQSGLSLAVLLTAVGCARATATPGAGAPSGQSAASVTVPAARSTPAPSASDQRVPGWVRGLLPELALDSAGTGLALVEAPNVVITRQSVVIEGHTVAALKDYGPSGRVGDPVLDFMKQLRREYLTAHPGVPFPGVATLWVDTRAPADAAGAVFESVAYAGFPNTSFAVRDRRATGRFVRVGVDAFAKHLSSTGKPPTGMPPAVIQGVIRARYPAMKRCYEQALAKGPELNGRVVVRFEIGPDGHVSNAKDQGSDFPDADTVACVLAVYRKLVFPKPRGLVTVVYPVKFAPE